MSWFQSNPWDALTQVICRCYCQRSSATQLGCGMVWYGVLQLGSMGAVAGGPIAGELQQRRGGNILPASERLHLRC